MLVFRMPTFALGALLWWSIPLTAFSSYDKRLPTPDGLEADVKFWQSIFTKFEPDHCVYHDSSVLKSIFIVKKVPESGRSRWRTLRREKKQIEKALKELGKGRPAKTALQKRVVRGTPSELRLPSYWKKAAQRVRCQRGVDFERSLGRSRKYLTMIKKIFRQYGIPEDLAYLPHLESGFNRWARSKAGARGLWQFISPVARSLGLTVRSRVDQRTDPYRSTVAAAKLLKRLKQKHEKWPLAVTAYNYGTNGMRRAIQKYGYDYMKIRKKHRTRIFKFAVKNYYPSILAVRNIAEGPDGSKQQRKQQNLLANYIVKRGDNLTQIARRFGLSIDMIMASNGLKSSQIYPGQKLKIGRHAGIETYRVRHGDNLTEIADKFDSTVRSIKKTNGLKNSVIYAGQTLRVGTSRL